MLTAAGAAFYLQREISRDGSSGAVQAHRRDLCAGRISLDKLVRWTAPITHEKHDELTVIYTYHFAAAKWARDPEVRRVFPVLARLIDGDGTSQLTQMFRLNDGRWMAMNPWDSTP